MAVSRISPSHSTQEEKPAAPAINRTNKGAAKDAAILGSPQKVHADGTQETPPAATTENHAGYEQGNRKQLEPENKGTQVNTYA